MNLLFNVKLSNTYLLVKVIWNMPKGVRIIIAMLYGQMKVSFGEKYGHGQ